jgi:hypothetical protein
MAKIELAPFSTIALKVHRAKPNFVLMLYRELPDDCEDADKWLAEVATVQWPEMFTPPEADADAAAAATDETPTPTEADDLAALTNKTQQGQYAKKFSQAALKALLDANGLTLGGPATTAAALEAAGGVKQPGAEKKSNDDDSGDVRERECRNVYADGWNGTPEQRAAKIASMIRGLGTAKVAQIAAAQNKRIDGTPLRTA